MKVTFRQSGGFGGLVKGCELDSERMPAEDAATLEALVQQSELAGNVVDHSPTARDVHRYDLTVNREGQTHRLSMDDRTIPDRVRALLHFLQGHATPRARH